jgi:hypothetical protein
MTAEIAILNRGSVALAADSAVTCQRQGGEKIYNSVNKLFMLSKYHPVGIMVYGTADLMGVPWETVIKSYRKRLGCGSFSTLREYVDDFLAHLHPDDGVLSKREVDRHFYECLCSIFYGVRSGVIERVKQIIARGGGISEQQVKKVFEDEVSLRMKACDRLEALECCRTLSVEALMAKYRSSLNAARKGVMQNLPISKATQEMLDRLAISLLLKDILSDQKSGIIVAGFGEKDTFPSVVAVEVDGFVDGKLRMKVTKVRRVSEQMSAGILPFAQSEMVHTFMEGIDPFYQEVLYAGLKDLFERLPAEIRAIGARTGKTLPNMDEELAAICFSMLDNVKHQASEYRRKRYVDPVIEAVSFLPKDELAAMAESLVNLTSFKRRISMDAETVGGPIDVAVISKGDGFIWIKRKHYFEPGLNPAFFANYYRDQNNRQQGEHSAESKEDKT